MEPLENNYVLLRSQGQSSHGGKRKRKWKICQTILPLHVRTQKTAVCKPGKGPLPEPDCAGTLILNFQPPELWETKSVV